MFPITSDNLAEVLTAIGLILTAIGGLFYYKVVKEPPKPGTPDAMAIGLVELTKAMQSMGGQFGENLVQFSAIVKLAERMADDIATSREHLAVNREHLSVIRDAHNRGAR